LARGAHSRCVLGVEHIDEGGACIESWRLRVLILIFVLLVFLLISTSGLAFTSLLLFQPCFFCSAEAKDSAVRCGWGIGGSGST
jgi:hypothetical protein